MRKVLHCDMDCFYAAVHMRDDPALAGLPVVIGGKPESRGVVAAASYEARAFGVRSAMPSARARRLCPDAVFLKPDFQRYRAESQKIFEIFRGFGDVVQPVSIDEAYLDVSEAWRHFGSATRLAQALRRRVLEERGLTVSVGVAPNKLLAKIASDADKPNGLTVVSPKKLQVFLDPLPVRALPGVGPVGEKRLKKAGLETIRELRARTVEELKALFGRYGAVLYEYARGRDERPVRIDRTRKSISSETTFAADLSRLDEIEAVLGRLAGQLAGGLERRELSAATVTIKVRYSDFTTVTRSRTLTVPTRDETRLRRTARELLERTEAGRRPVRLLGVGGSNLVPGGSEQLGLFRASEGESAAP